MDALILSLAPEQHKKYLELLKQENVKLDFIIEKIEFDIYTDENIKAAKYKIVDYCEKLISFTKSDSFFSPKLSKDEIDKLIPEYFGTINSISKIQRELYSEAIIVSRKINEAEKIHIDISKKYTDFLPYKAAFGKNDKYRNEILRIDNYFKREMENSLAQKKALANELARISMICDVLIPSFSKNSSRAADTPRFKSFNDKEFFNSVSAFMEQIKSV